LHIDGKLATRVAEGLGLKENVHPAPSAGEVLTTLKPSKALSLMQNGPRTFAGRKVGVLVTDGIERQLFDALKSAVEAEGAVLEVIAPTVGGVKASDGSMIEGHQKIGGGPSVLYDAVAILGSTEGVQMLLKNAAAKDFVSDAFAHLKFIAYSDAAMPLFEKAGIAADMDDGFVLLSTAKAASDFVSTCRKVRRWEREKVVTA
jgi:catalase